MQARPFETFDLFRLPDAVIGIVGSKLSCRDKCAARLVCRALRSQINSTVECLSLRTTELHRTDLSLHFPNLTALSLIVPTSQDLDEGGIVQSISTFLCKLRHIRRLRLVPFSENAVIPPHLLTAISSSWPDLVELEGPRLQVCDASVAALAGFRRLRTLRITNQEVALEDIALIAQQQTLQCLDINFIEGTQLPESLPAITSLRSLRMSGLQDCHVSWVTAMTALEVLDLSALPSHSVASDAVLEQICSLSRLYKLNLSSCSGVSNYGLCQLPNLGQLRELHLPSGRGYLEVYDHGMRALCRCSKLEHLELFSYSLSRDFAESLAQLQHLSICELFCCQPQLKHLFPSLTSLKVKYITGQGCAALRGHPVLRSVELDCRIAPGSCMSALSSLPSLEDCNVQLVDTFHDTRSLKPVHVTSLKLLWPGITNRDLEVLVRQNSALQHLHLVHCLHVTDQGLSALAGLKALRSITLQSCPGVTKKGIDALASLESLRQLHVLGSRVTWDDCRKVIQEHNHDLVNVEWRSVAESIRDMTSAEPGEWQ